MGVGKTVLFSHLCITSKDLGAASLVGFFYYHISNQNGSSKFLEAEYHQVTGFISRLRSGFDFKS